MQAFRQGYDLVRNQLTGEMGGKENGNGTSLLVCDYFGGAACGKHYWWSYKDVDRVLKKSTYWRNFK
jgi:hypothetical protein